MPWMPEVFSAPIAESLRAIANDAVPYYEEIMADEPEALVPRTRTGLGVRQLAPRRR